MNMETPLKHSLPYFLDETDPANSAQANSEPRPQAEPGPDSSQEEQSPSIPPEPPMVSLSQEEFDAALARATSHALAEARAEQAKLIAEQNAREAELARRRAAGAQPNSQIDAVEALDLRTDMLEEALTLHPDMPLEARQQLKEDLRQFKGIEQVRQAKDARLHIKLADAAAGQSLRSGRYVPKGLTSDTAVTREPVNTQIPPVPKIPDSYRRAVEADGLHLTEKELEEAYRLDSQRSW